MNTPENVVSLCHTPSQITIHISSMWFSDSCNSPRVVISQNKPKRAKSEMQSCLPKMPQNRQGGSFKQVGEGGRDRTQVLLKTDVL